MDLVKVGLEEQDSQSELVLLIPSQIVFILFYFLFLFLFYFILFYYLIG